MMAEKSESPTARAHVVTEDEGTTSTHDVFERRSMNRYVWAVLVTAILCSTFLFAINNTVVAVIQPHIIEELGGIEKFPWIAVAYNLGAASATLCWGKLYAQFEHKSLYIVAMIMFELGSAVCGASPNMNALIVGRALGGLGGNGLYIGTMNILSTMTSVRERPLYLSFVGVTWGMGTVLGPVIGGGLTSNVHAGWRWCFYINICIAALFAPVYLVILPTHKPQPHVRLCAKVKQFDFVGTVLFAGAFTSGAMAIAFGGAMYAWSSAEMIALFCTSGVLWFMFVLQQRSSIATTPQRRLFPVHLLSLRENWLLFAQTAVSITALYIPIYFIPLYYQFVRTDSTLEASIHLLPFICVAVFFCLLNGGLLGRLGYYMPWYLCGAIGITVGAVLMRAVDPNTPDNKLYGYSILLAAGVGAYVQAGFPVAQFNNPPSEVLNVLTFLNCAQASGITSGFAVANAIFINRVTSRIEIILPNAHVAEVQAAIAGVDAAVFESLPSDTRRAILVAVAKSLSEIYYQLIANGAFSIVISLFMSRKRLNLT